MKKLRKRGEMSNVVAILVLGILAFTLLFVKPNNFIQQPNASSTPISVILEKETTFVYYDTKKLPDCAINDDLPCAYSCAPDGMCVFIPNNRSDIIPFQKK